MSSVVRCQVARPVRVNVIPPTLPAESLSALVERYRRLLAEPSRHPPRWFALAVIVQAEQLLGERQEAA